MKRILSLTTLFSFSLISLSTAPLYGKKDPLQKEAKKQEKLNAKIEKWIDIAQNDLGDAQKLINGSNPRIRGTLYHCQQSAEKALKAYIIAKGSANIKTHSLSELLAECIQFESSFSTISPELKILNPFSTRYRYPNKHEVPDIDTALACIKHSEKVLAFIDLYIKEIPKNAVRLTPTFQEKNKEALSQVAVKIKKERKQRIQKKDRISRSKKQSNDTVIMGVA